VEVESRAGRHRLDFAWKKQKLALEFDGRTKYFDYGDTDEALFQERRREKALMEEGWRFIRIEWRDLFREQEFKSRILQALAHDARS
jgi:very-short-patch-repair endonuclease